GGADFVIRCGPALAGALGGATAKEAAAFPVASRVLVVCGSYVPQTVRQLAELLDRYPASVVTVKPAVLAAGELDTLAAVATRLAELLDGCGIAVLGVDGLPG